MSKTAKNPCHLFAIGYCTEYEIGKYKAGGKQ
jgi:hypothetical protein